MEVLLLVAGGLAAVLAGTLVLILSPGRLVSFLAAAALALLGVLQFGLARAVWELTEWSRTVWFALALALAIPVTALWLLLALFVGRRGGARGFGLWGPYLMLQTILGLGALAAAVFRRDIDVPQLSRIAPAFPLHGDDRAILYVVLLNLGLVAAQFEATHLSLPRRYRHAFRPALAGVLIAIGFFGYVISTGLLAGSFAIGDIALGSIPVMTVSLLLPLSFIRGRVGEARAMRNRHPVSATTSILIAGGFLFGTSALLWLTHELGLSLGRGLFVLTIAGLLFAVFALAISNRIRRRFQRMLDPLWADPRAAGSRLAAGALSPLEKARSLRELCDMIPANAREVAGLDPVTLFLARTDPIAFRSVASTLEPGPCVSVLETEPLAVELRRARRPIYLRGRTDDLEYVSIYVENGEQIAACEAACAIPLAGEEDLVGFLLCGADRKRGMVTREALVLLHAASRRYAAHLERLIRQQGAEQ
ncbi:MAG TPA: hypothetical protein VF363_07085 [Candidatus Eisenbacteria bacterium]